MTVSPSPMEILRWMFSAIRLSAAMLSPWLPVVMITVWLPG